MLLLCAYVALYDRSRSWRLIAWVACGLSAMLIVLSGNRTGALAAAVGLFVTSLPLLRQPRKFVLLVGTASILVTIVFFYLGDTYGMQRMFTLANTRETQWYTNSIIVAQAPVFGHGWIYAGPQSGYANLHSMYFQILAEMGFVGLLLFLSCLALIMLQWYQVYRPVRHFPRGSEFVMLPATFIVLTLAIGLFETGPLAGVMPDTLLLGFGVGLIDRLPRLLKQESKSRLSRYRFGALPVPGRQ